SNLPTCPRMAARLLAKAGTSGARATDFFSKSIAKSLLADSWQMSPRCCRVAGSEHLDSSATRHIRSTPLASPSRCITRTWTTGFFIQPFGPHCVQGPDCAPWPNQYRAFSDAPIALIDPLAQHTLNSPAKAGHMKFGKYINFP